MPMPAQMAKLIEDAQKAPDYETFAPIFAQLDATAIGVLYNDMSHHPRRHEVNGWMERYVQEYSAKHQHDLSREEMDEHHPDFLDKTTPISHVTGGNIADGEEPDDPPRSQGWVTAG